MGKYWKGSYTVETSVVFFIVLSILFLFFRLGIYQYEKLIVECEAAEAVIIGEDESRDGILLLNKGVIINRQDKKADYQLRFPIGKLRLIVAEGTKYAFSECDMDKLRAWKYVEEKRDENKQG